MAASSKRDSMVSCAPSAGATVIACIIPVTDASGLITKRLSAAVRRGGVDVVAGRHQHRVERVHDALRARRRARGEDHHRRLVGIATRRRRAGDRLGGTDRVDREPARPPTSTVGREQRLRARARPTARSRRRCRAPARRPALVGRDHHQRAEPQHARGSRRPRRRRCRRARTPRRRRRRPRAAARRPRRRPRRRARRRSANDPARRPPPAPGRGRAASRDEVDRLGAPVPGGAEPCAHVPPPAARGVPGQVVTASSLGAPPAPMTTRERQTRIRRGMLRSPAAMERDPAVPADRVGAGRAGRRAVGRPRAARRRPRPLAHRPPAARRRRRRRRRPRARAASAPARSSRGSCPTTLETMVVMVALGAPRRGPEPAHPDPARARGRLHHRPGRHRGVDHHRAVARVRPRRRWRAISPPSRASP